MTTEILDTVFFIEGKCNVTLDTFNSQYHAIKSFILEYKDKVSDAKLILVQGGRRFQMNPTGTPADYS